MKYKKIISRLLDQNIYILSNDKNEAIIIDPGLGFDLIDDYLKANNLSPIAVLATHAHIDHIASASDCISHYNIPFYICRGNSVMIEHYAIKHGIHKEPSKSTKEVYDRNILMKYKREGPDGKPVRRPHKHRLDRSQRVFDTIREESEKGGYTYT